MLTTCILGTMAMLCAPVRDEEVRRLRDMSDPIQLLRWIFRVLFVMKTDMANFTIQSLRPHLQDHSIQYERTKFQELLNKLPGSLDNTTEWLRKAAAEITSPPTSGANGSPTPDSGRASRGASAILSPTVVLNQGYMDLLHWDPGQEYPETLLMDQGRLQVIQSQVNQLMVIASVILVSSSVCGNVLFNSPGFVDKLKRVTQALLEGFKEALFDISNQVHQEVNGMLQQLGYLALSSDKSASLRGQIRSIADKDNAVRNIIEARIHLVLSHHLSPSSQDSFKNLPRGLAPIEEELLDLGQRFGSLIHHNRQVFGPYYSGILKKLLLPEVEPEAGINSF
uniref:T-complex 11 n=1 Tax=Sphenodon punctatus TaxID=8508 RepID=A0A8D0GCL1_SPHPU